MDPLELAAASCEERAMKALKTASNGLTFDREIVPLCEKAMQLLDLADALRARSANPTVAIEGGGDGRPS